MMDPETISALAEDAREADIALVRLFLAFAFTGGSYLAREAFNRLHPEEIEK